MSQPDLPFLQSDRIIFKLYACEEHLKNIKNIKIQHGDLLSKNARIRAEMEIDSLVSQMIGTFDSLLFRIIDRFQLSGIPSDKIDIVKVISVLSAESKRIELANELERTNKEGNWALDDKPFKKLFIAWFITLGRCIFGRHSRILSRLWFSLRISLIMSK